MSMWGSQSLYQMYRFLSLPQTELFHNLRTVPGAIAPEWHMSSHSLPLATITFLPVLEFVTLNSNIKLPCNTWPSKTNVCVSRLPKFVSHMNLSFLFLSHRLWVYPLSYGGAFWPFVVFGYHQQSQYKQSHRESAYTSFLKFSGM